jgi:hypothetical protein
MTKTKRSQGQQEIGIGEYLSMPSLFKQKTREQRRNITHLPNETVAALELLPWTLDPVDKVATLAVSPSHWFCAAKVLIFY